MITTEPFGLLFISHTRSALGVIVPVGLFGFTM